jgi:hypothetical protein
MCFAFANKLFKLIRVHILYSIYFIYTAVNEGFDPEAKYLIPDWGMKPATASGCRTGPSAYVAWRAGTTTRRHSQLHPSVSYLRIQLQDIQSGKLRNTMFKDIGLNYF